MKKILSLVLIVSFLFCLTACNKEKTSSNISSIANQTTSEKNDTTSKTNKNQEVATESNTPIHNSSITSSASNDKTPPIINTINLDKQNLSIGDTLNITVSATDDSEITSCRIVFRMSNGKEGNAWTDLQKGTDGLFYGSIAIDNSFVAGKCSFGWLQVDDYFSNSTLYTDSNGDFPNIYFNVS